MSPSSPAVPSKAVLRLLLSLVKSPMPPPRTLEAVVNHCRSEGLIVRAPRRHGAERGYRLTSEGRAFLARHREDQAASRVGAFRAQHLALGTCEIVGDDGVTRVTVDETESPLAWLARRGRIEETQFLAGEKLRADFTRGQMTPRVTSNWAEVPTGQSRSGGVEELSAAALAARQRVSRALDNVGPEFSGLLLDVCCFLRGLEDIERERNWPLRSGKIVLQLGLDRLARHYRIGGQLRAG